MSESDRPSNSGQGDSGPPNQLDRRALLIGTGAAAVGALSVNAWLRYTLGEQDGASVFIARNQRYDGPLIQTIRDGLLATGFKPDALRGRRVLLKPNMVEPIGSCPHMTTHPSMVLATVEVFRGWGAKVRIGEAPGHVRDTELALEESRLGEVLDVGRVDFADLNYEEVAWTKNAGNVSPLKGFFFPQAVAEADVVVSMPKLKTHHWVGLTAALKNLMGTLPGCMYGWPKNVLHHAGIPHTVFDINASLPKAVAVIDGIVCMEGDGPIMGSAKPMGLVLVGTNPTAVDATCARIIGLEPDRIPYLAMAAGKLGPLDEGSIYQCGERWQSVASPFQILDKPHLRSMRPGVLTS